MTVKVPDVEEGERSRSGEMESDRYPIVVVVAWLEMAGVDGPRKERRSRRSAPPP